MKVLRPELAAVIGAERFLSEIKTTANLQHPHILPLFDSGVARTAAESSTDLLTQSPNRPIADTSTTSCPSSRASRSATG